MLRSTTAGPRTSLDRLPALAGRPSSQAGGARLRRTAAPLRPSQPRRQPRPFPFVFMVPERPGQKLGLVASLSRPGGNLTGVNLIIGELMWKSGWHSCASWCLE